MGFNHIKDSKILQNIFNYINSPIMSNFLSTTTMKSSLIKLNCVFFPGRQDKTVK